jgi:hypothetical protein
MEVADVLVVDERPETPIRDSIRILCQVQDVDGDFKQIISLYLKDATLSSLLTDETLGKFCNELDCDCLISDDSDNPYSMRLIQGKNDFKTVYLSPEFLEEDQYVLSGKVS